MSNDYTPPDPAFPNPEASEEHFGRADIYMGLTKREIFAAMAMQGLLSNSAIAEMFGRERKHVGSWMQEQAVIHADSLIKELAK